MAAIKDIAASADKWNRRASVAGADYERGVQNPRRSWAQAAQASDAVYRQAVTAAANAGRYGAGVRRAGEEAWRQGAVTKGVTRFPEGVAVSVGKWQEGFAPYQQAIQAITLPDRGAKGSPANLQRVAAIAQSLRQVKERQLGGGR